MDFLIKELHTPKLFSLLQDNILKLKTIITGAIFALSSATVTAEDSGWSQSLSFGLNLAKGNTDSTQFSGSYDGKKSYTNASLALKANGAFGEENSTKNTDNYSFVYILIPQGQGKIQPMHIKHNSCKS